MSPEHRPAGATPRARAPIVELRDVTKRYVTGGETVEALKGVDFDAAPGEFVSVMGPSGSGKSTMLNVLGLLDAPTSGTVLLDGRDVTDLTDREQTAERKRSIGFVFQQFYLIPTLTALENVELPTLFGPDPTARERAIDLLERVGLGNRLGHRPDQLSGGQKQRVAVARALVNEPRVLLADEPTGNLDRQTGRSVLDEFTRIKDGRDVAVVAVTHDPQVSEFADRTVELVDGRVDRESRRPAAPPSRDSGRPIGTGSGGSTGGATAERSADRPEGDAGTSNAEDVLDGEDATGGDDESAR